MTGNVQVCKTVRRVAKVTKMNNGFKIEMAVEGLLYPTIGELNAKKVAILVTEDGLNNMTVYSLSVWFADGSYSVFAFDEVKFSEDSFMVESVENYNFDSKLTKYVPMEVA